VGAIPGLAGVEPKPVSKVFVVEFKALFESSGTTKDLELLHDAVLDIEKLLNNAGARIVVKEARWMEQ
jgi:hypothetical protein